MSPKVSTNQGGHTRPSTGQVDPEGGRPTHFGGKGSTDIVKSVWPRNMADRPRGGRPTVLCHRIIAAKPRNHIWDAINTSPTLSTGIYTPYIRFSICKGSGAFVVA
jgi:hypothetical protein